MTNKELIPLTFNYIGDREYVHGTSIFDQISSIIKSRYGKTAFISSLNIRKFAKHQCMLIIGTINTEDVIATCKITTSNGMLNGCLVETNDPITTRTEYNEEPIYASAVLNKRKIIQQYYASQYSPIQQVVSLTKHLHYFEIPDINGKWIFVQLDLSRPFVNDKIFTIEIKQIIPKKFTMSTIKQADNMIGSIRFAVANP